MKKIAIIGAGASGMFLAANLPISQKYKVEIFEKADKALQKVLISGGGRCNATHVYNSPKLFPKNYPRGEKQIKDWLRKFSPLDFENWLKNLNICLNTESDGRMFPSTNKSETIANAILNKALDNNVKINYNSEIVHIEKTSIGFRLTNIHSELFEADILVGATGGAPKLRNYAIWENLNIKISPPQPSLFTFKLLNKSIASLMGISVPNAQINIVNTAFEFSGPLLITHWGFSGPAVLKLSAFAALYLASVDYSFSIRIKWIKNYGENEWKQWFCPSHKCKVINHNPAEIPKRLWSFILELTGIDPNKQVNQFSKKEIHKLIDSLIRSVFEIRGKTTYKEEFVTAGGIALTEINADSMLHHSINNLYFIGELLDIDGITGGFNFQNAWTTSKIAADDILNRLST